MRLLNCILLGVVCIGCSSKLPTVIATRTDDPSTSDSTNTLADEIIIDVRTQKEWDSGHLAQAIHIPYTEIAQEIGDVASDKDAKIVLYCASGARSGKAKEVLDELGYTHVENAGGYDDIQQRSK